MTRPTIRSRWLPDDPVDEPAAAAISVALGDDDEDAVVGDELALDDEGSVVVG